MKGHKPWFGSVRDQQSCQVRDKREKTWGMETILKQFMSIFFLQSYSSLLSTSPPKKAPFLSIIFFSPARELLWKGKIWDRWKQSQLQTVNLSWWSVFKGDVLLNKCCPRTFPSFVSLHLVRSQLKNKMCWGATSLSQLCSWHPFKTFPPSQQTFNPKAKSFTNRGK